MTTRDINVTEMTTLKQVVDFNFKQDGTLTGNRKLVQTWVRLFLTEVGSQKYYPTKGTRFLEIIRTGGIRRDADVPIQFKIAADAVAAILASDPDTELLPDTEQLVSAELLDYFLSFKESLLKLSVKLTPVSGETITLNVPISTQG